MTSYTSSDLLSELDLEEIFPEDFLEPDKYDQPPSFSEDLLAIEAQRAEVREKNNKQGRVIQHRAWSTNQVFFSDQFRAINSPTSKYSHGKLPGSSMPSSPPIDRATVASSDHENESPSNATSARKRIRLDEPRSPLKPMDRNVRMIAGFLVESDDEDDEPELLHKPEKLTEAPIALKSPVSSPVAHTVVDPEYAAAPALDATLEKPRKASSLLTVNTFSGRTVFVGQRLKRKPIPVERMVASRSITEEGRAKKAFYGIEVHKLLEDINLEKTLRAAQMENMDHDPAPAKPVIANPKIAKSRHVLWTEKYRARKFTDLIGDERTHRLVMHWLKSWDTIVFPGAQSVKKPFSKRAPQEEPPNHAKILLLTGPPGLGKTTLAHVCARQAGYEVHEINASDERSRDVVKGKIRDMVGTENVRGINQKTESGMVRKAGRPVCVVVDEVDGVVGNSGGNEGGFVKALIDLLLLDQKNSSRVGGKKRKGDNFRLLRPLVLICNDVYHPSLRPLRQSSLAEIVHVRKPAIHNVSNRIHSIFEREGIPCDADGIRRLCEATWGVSTRKDASALSGGTSDGDVRSVLVVGEWVASRFKADCVSTGEARLSKRWVEEHILSELAYGGGAARSLGRSSTKEVVDRVFLRDAGFVKASGGQQTTQSDGKRGPAGVAEAGKRQAMSRLKDLVDASGEIERVVTGTSASIVANFAKLDRYLYFLSHSAHPGRQLSHQTQCRLRVAWLLRPSPCSVDQFSRMGSCPLPLLPRPRVSQPVCFIGSDQYLRRTIQALRQKVRTGRRCRSSPSVFHARGPIHRGRASQGKHCFPCHPPRQLIHHSLTNLPLSCLMATELLPYVLRMLAPAIKPVVIQTSQSAKMARNTTYLLLPSGGRTRKKRSTGQWRRWQLQG